jgi:hypothetical protein
MFDPKPLGSKSFSAEMAESGTEIAEKANKFALNH